MDEKDTRRDREIPARILSSYPSKGYWICFTMTRRLLALPAAVAFVSIGKSGP